MSFLVINNISRKEDEKFVVEGISFTQQSSQHIAIAGATGSGKTTLLRMIAGLMQPHEGEILFKGVRVKGPDEKLIPGHPSIAYLSQHFELRNHYHVEELLQMNNQLPGDEAQTIYQVCRIDHLLKRWSHQLSGGERQRIALACLLVRSPKLLLLDEPYSNLDTIHKNILKAVINDLSEHENITCLLVAHDPSDVLPWADEIMVLQQGRLIQKGLPEIIYRQPVNEYTAALFGKYNVLTPALTKAFSAFTDISMSSINDFLRPEDFKIATSPKGVKAKVKRANFIGQFYELELNVAGSMLIVNSQKSFQPGDDIFISL